MNYPPNTKRWQVGDFVLHDADAKELRMLMKVIGYETATGFAKTRYAFPSAGLSKRSRRRIWFNDIMYLLDPADFAIDVSKYCRQSAVSAVYGDK